MAHLAEHLFGGDAAIHSPNPLRLAVLCLDLLQDGAQRGVVGSVSWQDLIGQWKPAGVTINAITTCTQSRRLSRLWPKRRLSSSSSGGSDSK
jgi:hypothetical protein